MAAAQPHGVVPMGLEKNKLYISILEARDLIAADIGGTSDPYIVVKECAHGLEGKAKTSIKKKTLNPVWNQHFELNFDTRLHRLCFKAYDHDAIGSDDSLGKAYFDMTRLYKPGEQDLWLDLGTKRNGTVFNKGQVHIKIRAEWRIPVAWPGQWLPPFTVQHFTLGLGWDFSKKSSPIDLDASVIALAADHTVIDRIFFGNLRGLGGAVVHSGDNRTGEGKGDDEQIHFDLAKIPANVVKFVFTVNVFGGQPLSTVKSAYCRLVDAQRTLAFVRCDKLDKKTGLFFGYMVKVNGLWYFQAIIQTVNGRTAVDSLKEIIPILSTISPPQPRT